MTPQTILFSTLIILNLVTMVVSDPCFDMFSAVQNDMYMEHHTYSKVITYSRYACAAQCLMSSVCLSFSYNTHRHICHLNDNNTAVTDIVSRHGFIYSDIGLWPKTLSGPCAVTSCPSNSRCQVDRLLRVTCVPEFRGCGEPLDVANSSKKYEGRFLAAVVIYTCQLDYTKCQNKTTSVCQSTGQWEDVTGLCGQFRWHNPIPSTDFLIPCGATDSFRVTVVGTPTRSVRTTVHTFSGKDNLFHVDFRFKYVGTFDKIWINTQIAGTWGAPITLSTMPLSVGQQFIMELSLQNGVYTVMVNSVHIYSLQERLPGVKPNNIRIENDVSLQLVTFSI